MIVTTLLVLSLASLDAVIDAGNERDAIRRAFLMEQAAGAVPIELGIRSGALAGLAIAASAFRRVLPCERDGDAPRRRGAIVPGGGHDGARDARRLGDGLLDPGPRCERAP